MIGKHKKRDNVKVRKLIFVLYNWLFCYSCSEYISAYLIPMFRSAFSTRTRLSHAAGLFDSPTLVSALTSLMVHYSPQFGCGHFRGLESE